MSLKNLSCLSGLLVSLVAFSSCSKEESTATLNNNSDMGTQYQTQVQVWAQSALMDHYIDVQEYIKFKSILNQYQPTKTEFQTSLSDVNFPGYSMELFLSGQNKRLGTLDYSEVLEAAFNEMYANNIVDIAQFLMQKPNVSVKYSKSRCAEELNSYSISGNHNGKSLEVKAFYRYLPGCDRTDGTLTYKVIIDDRPSSISDTSLEELLKLISRKKKSDKGENLAPLNWNSESPLALTGREGDPVIISNKSFLYISSDDLQLIRALGYTGERDASLATFDEMALTNFNLKVSEFKNRSRSYSEEKKADEKAKLSELGKVLGFENIETLLEEMVNLEELKIAYNEVRYMWSRRALNVGVVAIKEAYEKAIKKN